eukprot:scaffold2269_cov221-Pinguiococcus_pyrenoidosus.AAC.3
MRHLLGKRPATPLGHALDLLPKGLVFLANQLQVSLDSIAVLLRYSTLQSLLETLQVARLALLPSDAGGGLDELLEGGLELLKLPIGRHLRFLSLAGLCALEDLLVDQHLCPSEALTDGVDASLHLSDIGHNTLDLLLLLRNALDDVHDAIRVQGAVDVLRHGLVLVCEQLGTLFLVLELARHLLHLRLVSEGERREIVRKRLRPSSWGPSRQFFFFLVLATFSSRQASPGSVPAAAPAGPGVAESHPRGAFGIPPTRPRDLGGAASTSPQGPLASGCSPWRWAACQASFSSPRTPFPTPPPWSLLCQPPPVAQAYLHLLQLGLQVGALGLGLRKLALRIHDLLLQRHQNRFALLLQRLLFFCGGVLLQLPARVALVVVEDHDPWRVLAKASRIGEPASLCPPRRALRRRGLALAADRPFTTLQLCLGTDGAVPCAQIRGGQRLLQVRRRRLKPSCLVQQRAHVVCRCRHLLRQRNASASAQVQVNRAEAPLQPSAGGHGQQPRLAPPGGLLRRLFRRSRKPLHQEGHDPLGAGRGGIQQGVVAAVAAVAGLLELRGQLRAHAVSRGDAARQRRGLTHLQQLQTARHAAHEQVRGEVLERSHVLGDRDAHLAQRHEQDALRFRSHVEPLPLPPPSLRSRSCRSSRRCETTAWEVAVERTKILGLVERGTRACDRTDTAA